MYLSGISTVQVFSRRSNFHIYTNLILLQNKGHRENKAVYCVSHWAQRETSKQKASWIWTSNVTNTDTTLYIYSLKHYLRNYLFIFLLIQPVDGSDRAKTTIADIGD